MSNFDNVFSSKYSMSETKRLINGDTRKTIVPEIGDRSKMIENRSAAIDRMIIERRSKGEYLPEPGASVEYRTGSSSSVGRVLGYDTNKHGELIVLTLLSGEETRRTGVKLVVVGADKISRTHKRVTDLIVR